MDVTSPESSYLWKLNGLVSSSLLQRHSPLQNHVDSMPPRGAQICHSPAEGKQYLRDDFYCATPTVCFPLSLSVTSPLCTDFQPL